MAGLNTRRKTQGLHAEIGIEMARNRFSQGMGCDTHKARIVTRVRLTAAIDSSCRRRGADRLFNKLFEYLCYTYGLTRLLFAVLNFDIKGIYR